MNCNINAPCNTQFDQWRAYFDMARWHESESLTKVLSLNFVDWSLGWKRHWRLVYIKQIMADKTFGKLATNSQIHHSFVLYSTVRWLKGLDS